MNIPSLLGSVLALCLPGLVALAPVAQQRPGGVTPGGPSALPAPESLEVRHREGASYYAATQMPGVLDVRATIERATLLVGPGGDLATRTRAALEGRYGARVSEESAPPHYTWVWNGERWVIVCFSSTTFAVDLGRHGTVEVEVKNRVVLP